MQPPILLSTKSHEYASPKEDCQPIPDEFNNYELSNDATIGAPAPLEVNGDGAPTETNGNEEHSIELGGEVAAIEIAADGRPTVGRQRDAGEGQSARWILDAFGAISVTVH